MRHSHLILGLILSLVMVACGSRKSIPERKLVRMLAEMHLADAVLEVAQVSSQPSWRSDSTAVYTAILDRYGYTTEQLYATLARYNSSKDKATALYDKVSRRLEKLQKSATGKVEALHRKQNRWTEKSEWALPKDGDTSRVPFSIPVEGLGEYILEATVVRYNADSVSRPRMTLCLYAAASDSLLLRVEREVQRSEEGQRYSLSIVNRDGAATHVRGYLFDYDADSLRPTRRIAAKNVMLRFLPSAEEEQRPSSPHPPAEARAPVDTSPPVRVSVIDDARRPPRIYRERQATPAPPFDRHP
ncbi:MAG: DUF4296 domain-containing protein [Prevotellaceae bacterium]|jgi:hypothetical protein|nr:DUF4296 domain-containing protein [Prevotellaceae bacterium]